MGGLLGCNVLCFAGFLPLALGVSLGVIYENFWITLLSAVIGGAIAGPFWAAFLKLCLRSAKGSTAGWFTLWYRALVCNPAATVICVSLVFGVISTLTSLRKPDMQIAFIHNEYLPDGVANALEDSLAACIPDMNGDGAVIVQVNDYPVVFDGNASDSSLQTAGSTLLVTDLAAGTSTLYVTADPNGFLSLYADKVDRSGALLWSEYPVLAGLDAGTYSTVEDIYTELSGQTLLCGMTVLPAANADEKLIEILLADPVTACN